MPTLWQYTTFLDCLDHWQSLLAGIIALLAALIAVVVTVRIERWKAREADKNELLEEIRATNVATMVAFGLCNTVLGSKKQLIKPLKINFDQQKELMKQAMQQRKQGEAIDFHADFRTLPALVLPLTILQNQIFDKISVDSRPISLMTTLTQVAEGLNNSIMVRNQLIEIFKTRSFPLPRLVAVYYGFPFNDGQRDENYSDSMQAISAQADDMIFFSSQLCKELSDHGDKLAESYATQFRKTKPRIIKPDFSKARDGDLMPDEKHYADWFNMFPKRQGLPIGRFRRLRSWFGA